MNKHPCMSAQQQINDLITNLTSTIDFVIADEDNQIPFDLLRKLDPLLAKLRSNIKSAYPPEQIYHDKKTKYQKKNRCYICKARITQESMRHPEIPSMCQTCGAENVAKKTFTKDLTGKIAIVTGGRIKIGFETAIRLLRCNCTVIVTSRFVDNCLERYSQEPDFETFRYNLHIYQLNMLSNTSISKFIAYINETYPRIDYLINNAAQTIRRPIQFYQHLLNRVQYDNHDNIVYRDAQELKLLEISDLNPKLLTHDSNSQNLDELFPPGQLDQFKQQLDLRQVNSWNLEANQVDLAELAEVYIINAIAPFILATKLRPLMCRKDSNYTWIINVTSMEGVFNWSLKSSRHPHTNMAKAALNMFTRTSAQDFIRDNIVMDAVDTGWNNAQQPGAHDLLTPLDCADGAARILDPIFRDLKTPGILYKDFERRQW